jgi:TonB family protein
MRPVFGSALVFLAFTAFAEGQDRAVSPQHLEVPTSYPNVARAARLQGTVMVKLTISSDGKVVAADATSSDALLRAHPLLQRDAAELTRRWRFTCFNCAKETEHPYDVIFTYRLEGKESTNPDARITVDLPNQVTVTANPPIAMPD